MVNPKLGNYFAIFSSGFVCLTLLVLVCEQLKAPLWAGAAAMLVFPVLAYILIGALSYTQDSRDYFASGRRVPSFYSGLVLAITAAGATGILAVAGTFFSVGFDALCIYIGATSGFVVMAILLAPFLRKFGAYTVPSYLARRFQSRSLRILAAAVAAITMLLAMTAELQLAIFAASELVPLSPTINALFITVAVGLCVAGGGLRSLSWSNTAQAIVILIAVLIPVAIIAIYLTNIPIPQLSFGPILREMVRNEPALAVPAAEAGWFTFNFPEAGLEPMAKRFVEAFGHVGPLAFFFATTIFLTGIAGSPWLLPRVSATPGVYEARKSLGWATVIFGVLMLTLLAVAVFLRHYIFEAILVPQADGIAPWLRPLIEAGYAALPADQSRVVVTTLSVKRDGVFFSLPLAAGLPKVFWMITVTGAVALAIAALSATAVALGNIISEDVVYGLTLEPIESPNRLSVARLGVVVALGLALALTLSAPSDPLRLWMWSLSIIGAALFPVLVLSIWWKRLNGVGAASGMLAGAATAIIAILLAEAGGVGLDGRIAGILGLPVCVGVAMGVAVLSRAPGRHELELVRDIRIPGGEILYDREMRKQRLRKRKTA